MQFDWLVAQPYGLSICLAFTALTVAERGAGRRHSIAALLLLALACWINIGIIVMAGIATALRASRPARLLACQAASMTFAVLLFRYAASVPTGQTAAVLRSGATVIAGDYWHLWPAVFHANLALARARSHAHVFGLAYRSEATDALWKAAGRPVLIAASPGDAAVAPIADEHGIAVTLLQHLPAIDLYTGRP